MTLYRTTKTEYELAKTIHMKVQTSALRGLRATLFSPRAGYALGLIALVLVAACQGEYPQNSLDPKTDFAETIHSLYVNVFWWTMVILAVVWSVLAYIVIRFRENPDRPAPRQIHGHLGMEIAWTIGPAIIVVAIAIPTIQAVFRTQTPPPAEDNALVVEVVGHQYWWEYRYPDLGVSTANELHLPVGRPITLKMWSVDVIHSFWVPQLGGKRDVNPLRRVPEGQEARYTWLYFTINEEGTFLGQCAEFCGEAHSLMRTRVVAESEAEFDDWVDTWQTPGPTAAAPALDPETGQPAPAEDPQIALGRTAFFSTTCIACHAVQGTPAQGVIGPNLTRLGGRSTIGAGLLENTRANLVRWIATPHEVKPGVRMPGAQVGGGGFPPTNLSDEQVQAIATYLGSLR